MEEEPRVLLPRDGASPGGTGGDEAWSRRLKELEVGALRLRDGRTLAYHVDGDIGSGAPVVLCLHGMISSRLLWVGERAPEGCVLVAPDRPGYGGSSDPGLDYCYTDFARDMEALMDHLSVPRFAVVGHSSGGPNALAVAAVLPRRRALAVACLGGDTEYTHPSPVTPADPMSKDLLCCLALPCRRLWLKIGAPLLLRCGSLFFKGLGIVAARYPQQFLRSIIAPEDLPLWEEREGRGFFRRALVESTKAGVWASSARRGMGGMVSDFSRERARRWDFDPGAIECPVLFWSGEHDEPCLESTRFSSAVLCPGSSLRVLPGRGHLGVLAPDTLGDLLQELVAAAASADSPASGPSAADAEAGDELV